MSAESCGLQTYILCSILDEEKGQEGKSLIWCFPWLTSLWCRSLRSGRRDMKGSGSFRLCQTARWMTGRILNQTSIRLLASALLNLGLHKSRLRDPAGSSVSFHTFQVLRRGLLSAYLQAGTLSVGTSNSLFGRHYFQDAASSSRTSGAAVALEQGAGECPVFVGSQAGVSCTAWTSQAPACPQLRQKAWLQLSSLQRAQDPGGQVA